MVTLTQREKNSTYPVPRAIFGNFMESGFAQQIPRMWSEMLFNRSFRQVTPLKTPTWEWLGFGPEQYNENAPFWHSGYEENDWEYFGKGLKADYTLGTQTFKGKTSLHLEGDGSRCGVRQEGLHLKARRGYTLRIFMGVRGDMLLSGLDGYAMSGSEGAQRPVSVRLIDDNGAVVWQQILTVTVGQREYVLPVQVARDCTAALEISFEYSGGLYLSWSSMMPNDNLLGWRPDVVDCLRRAGVPRMRFPGGCFVSFYDWEKSIGPRQEREPMESFYWGGLEENDVGLDEFCDLAELVGFEPQICFNMMSSTPFKARQMVEYLNAPADVGMGRQRLLNGHPAPRGVRLFEMDNESSRKWDALQYARECVRFAEEMRLADQTIELMMIGYNFPLYRIPQMLDIAGGHVNYIVQRNGEPEFVAQMLEILREYNGRTGRNIRLVNTEWLPSCQMFGPLEDPEIPENFSWDGTITGDYRKCFSFFQIRWMYALNAAQRWMDFMSYGGEFASANFNNCCNTWGQNILNASKDSAWLSCAGQVLELFTRSFLDGCQSIGFESSQELVTAQMLQAPNGQRRLYLLNRTREEQTVRLPAGTWSAQGLTAPHRLAVAEEGENPVEFFVPGLNGESVTVKPLSISVLCG